MSPHALSVNFFTKEPAGTLDPKARGIAQSFIGTGLIVGMSTLFSVPPKEFELLEAFLRRKGRLLTRDFLIEEGGDRTTSATPRRSMST